MWVDKHVTGYISGNQNQKKKRGRAFSVLWRLWNGSFVCFQMLSVDPLKVTDALRNKERCCLSQLVIGWCLLFAFRFLSSPSSVWCAPTSHSTLSWMYLLVESALTHLYCMRYHPPHYPLCNQMACIQRSFVLCTFWQAEWTIVSKLKALNSEITLGGGMLFLKGLV